MIDFLKRLFGKTPLPPHTSRLYGKGELSIATGSLLLGSETYAQVSSAWLASFYDDFRAVLFREGITRADAGFDCNAFAAFYVALANVRFYTATYPSTTPGRLLALGEFWYRRQSGEGHAVVIAMTERGETFIEPQTGKQITLTPAERASAMLIKF